MATIAQNAPQNTTQAAMTIGKLARAAGVGVETIRYYEKSGFLPEPERLASGYRVYSVETLRRLHFIREGQALGFTLAEISDLMALTDSEEADCAAVNARAQAKLSDIDAKIARLQAMRDGLSKLADYCPSGGEPLSECSIVRHLYGDCTDASGTTDTNCGKRHD